MKNTKKAGYKELAHTADISLWVWAETLEELFAQAASGMNHLIKPVFKPDVDTVQEMIVLQAMDEESLLVAFLSELVLFVDDQQVAFTEFDIEIDEFELTARCNGKKFEGIEQDIKAVTYSNLEIRRTDPGWETTIVFDI